MMNSAFNPETCTWEIGWPGRVAKHDVVYLSPPSDPMQGMPIGNGDVGVLCWCEPSRIVMAVNKCDLWDDASFGRFHNWKAEEEEYSTTLRHAGRIIVDFNMPVFDLFYLSDFRGRISLADASLSFAAAGPLGSVAFRAFVSHDDGTICCETETNLKEDVPVEIYVERYGSRTFSHWYSLVNRDASIGLAGACSSADEDGTYITHKLTSGRFAVGCKVMDAGGAAVHYSKEHSHCAKATVSGNVGKKCAFVVAVTPPLESDPLGAVREKLDAAEKKGLVKLLTAHKKAWKTFWLRSLMEYGDDYLDNLWHLAMYYANSSQRGKYPGRFINGLWGWNRDVQPWDFYFHWNQQQIYWPLNAAGHHELLDSYLDYRFNSLPYAKEDARDIFGVDGAVVSDVCERRGYNSKSEFLNHTPVAQIAMDFWRQYKFTGDAAFLKNRALPYVLEAAKFFESLFEKGDDGKYHATESSGYEGWIKLRDCISELVCARVLFSTAIEALHEAGVDESRAEKWKDILDNLAPLPVINGRDRFLVEENGALKLARGIFKGDATDSDEVFAAGLGAKEGRMLTSFIPSDQAPAGPVGPCEMINALENPAAASPVSPPFGDLKCNDGIFPWVEFSTMFPSGLIGLSQGDSPQFKAAVNTAKLFGICGVGWDPTPIVLARLGLAREVAETLKLWPGRWQLYRNGFGHYGLMDLMRADAALRFRTNLVQDASLPEKERQEHRFPFPTWPFRHMGMEPMSVLACAMNESLLQSHDGVIRVAPAAFETQNARFTLHATGGFVVSSELEHGKPLWVFLVSRRGTNCHIENPWPRAHLYQNGRHIGSFGEGTIEFDTQEDDVFILAPEEVTSTSWQIVPVDYERNAAPKNSSRGDAFLGLPGMF
ncbi:MAG: hypothetical protein CVU38_05120 [Chloroflexi bacterium HGW-Chloroflexi-1]|nr:MAG: hypothetical protein CVU38_05120 [Chloroflexi bacterium HGW-Chloroflexi-1]